ncbi:MAG TPA: rod-binding protein [Spirochaetota bacterium]|nr:rod-binding protein [Spirochaetota bacterium]HPJ38829.1 rod-binding protein [Spirochaetota bacterium]HPQ53401.1 rod-binding protein [Spirochaetota bacterium]
MIPVQNISEMYSNQRHTQNVQSLERNATTSTFRDMVHNNLHNSNVHSDAQSGTAGQNRQRPVDRRLMETCVEMESLLVSQMLKAMRKTVQKNEMFHGGRAEEIFEDMLYDEYALRLSKTSNLGIARTMYDQLSRQS